MPQLAQGANSTLHIFKFAKVHLSVQCLGLEPVLEWIIASLRLHTLPLCMLL